MTPQMARCQDCPGRILGRGIFLWSGGALHKRCLRRRQARKRARPDVQAIRTWDDTARRWEAFL